MATKKVKKLTSAQIRQGREIAEKYEVLIGKEDGEYVARSVECWPNIGTGDTIADAVAECNENVAMAVASMLADGIEPPAPAAEGLRTMQINIRVSAREKARMEAAARQKGFNGIADYVRAAVLAG